MAAKAEKNYIGLVISRQLDQIRTFEKKAGKHLSVESTHQLRVASRRLDTYLDVFKKIFRRKKVKVWRQNLHQLLRGLGKLRDQDVLLSFLKNGSGRKSPKSLIGDGERKRLKLEQVTITSLAAFKKTRTTVEIADGLKGSQVGEKRLRGLGRRNILNQLEELEDLGRFADKPGRSDELHQMRLTLKGLRYILEGFDRLYEGKLKKYGDYCAKLQTHLGEMHDREIWLKDRSLKIHAKKIKILRDDSYEKFRRLWHKGLKGKIWRKLEQVLE